ncbi:MAG TPA: hypothetical protein VMT86_07965 [Bryobacteraceae bacterium]|nr:hypothetical protein [Bryobacteraceae bacterium]
MNRRDFIRTTALGVATRGAEGPLIVPVHRVEDVRAKCTPPQLQRFWWSIWPEAVREFNRCGIQIQTDDARGEIKRSAGDRPIFVGVEYGVLNLVLTDHIPMYWDGGRGLAGATTLWEGYHLCVIAIANAHGNQLPFVSTNTCVHELLHALMQDIFVHDPSWFRTGEGEFRIDALATRMWLFHDGAAVRQSARVYLRRLRYRSTATTS